MIFVFLFSLQIFLNYAHEEHFLENPFKCIHDEHLKKNPIQIHVEKKLEKKYVSLPPQTAKPIRIKIDTSFLDPKLHPEEIGKVCFPGTTFVTLGDGTIKTCNENDILTSSKKEFLVGPNFLLLF